MVVHRSWISPSSLANLGTGWDTGHATHLEHMSRASDSRDGKNVRIPAVVITRETQRYGEELARH